MIVSKEIWGALSVALAVAGYSRYFWHILKRRTKPHAFSWIVWSLSAGIAFFAQLSDNAGPGAWGTGAGALTFFVIAGLSVFWGERRITRSDWVAFILALAAIPLWVFTGNPLGAVLLVTAIDVAAYYPTFRKTWLRPHEETALTHGFDALRFIPELLAMNNYSVITLFYPAVVTVVDIMLALMIAGRRVSLARAAITAVKK